MPTKLSDLENFDRDFLTSAQVAPILGTDPNLIRWQAHNEPEMLGFPVIVIRSRVKIPKVPFIKFMRGEQSESPLLLQRDTQIGNDENYISFLRFHEYATNQTKAGERLCQLIDEYEKEYFSDMCFRLGTIVDDFIKYKYEWSDTYSADDHGISLPSSDYLYYVKELDEGITGLVDNAEKTMTIAPEYAEDKAVILHEMIHCYEDIITESCFPYMHDILLISLYKELRGKILDLDDRVVAHTHDIAQQRITRRGGSHDLLFFLKTLDLDLRCGYKLGTVCGYGRDEYGETDD